MCQLTLKSRARYTVTLAPIPTDLCYAQLRAVIENVKTIMSDQEQNVCCNTRQNKCLRRVVQWVDSRRSTVSNNMPLYNYLPCKVL